jgi:hypothetical protein
VKSLKALLTVHDEPRMHGLGYPAAFPSHSRTCCHLPALPAPPATPPQPSPQVRLPGPLQMPLVPQVVVGVVAPSTLKPPSQASVQEVFNARLPDESALVRQGQVPLVTPGRALTGHTTGAAAMGIRWGSVRSDIQSAVVHVCRRGRGRQHGWQRVVVWSQVGCDIPTGRHCCWVRHKATTPADACEMGWVT